MLTRTLLGAMLLSCTTAAMADEFRISTKIFVGKADEPASQNVTLFREGLVYDCMDSPEEIAVFDQSRQRFILLSPPQRMRTELPFSQLETRLANLQVELRKKAAEESAGGLSAFLSSPKFEESTISKLGVTTFHSPWFHYEIKTEEARGTISARQYSDFIHWYTRLNAVRNPAMLAREPINEWLSRGNRMPVSIELTTFKKGALGGMSKLASYRSQHNVAWALSVEDRKKVDEIERWLVSFDPISFEDYRDSQKADQ